MAKYAEHVSSKTTPQTQAIPGRESEMAANNAGGVTFTLDTWTQMDRFLILGCEGGSYYATERKMTIDNAQSVRACIAEDGVRAVNRIVEISVTGRAHKNDPALFALALAASADLRATRRAALDAIPQVCRTGTHLFDFVNMVKEFRGFGRGLRDALAKWYTGKTPDKLAMQLLKYKQRNGVTHHDLAHKCHVQMDQVSPVHDDLLQWSKLDVHRAEVADGRITPRESYDPKRLPKIIDAYERVQKATSANEVHKLVSEYGLTREMVPSQFLSDTLVQEALLEHAPITATIRNLGGMTASGFLRPGSEAVACVVERLTDAELIKKGRVHPMSVLFAMRTYQQGSGFRGGLSWSPNRQIVDALDAAFYLSFGNVEPAGKRTMLALDVSGSMESAIANSCLSCRDASAAMALITARVEPQYLFTGFTSSSGRSAYGRRSADPMDGISELDISPRQRLDDVIKRISGLPFGGTDCAKPMQYAEAKGLDIDTFVVYTDNETWAGTVQPVQALQRYRDKTGIPARLVVVGMTATNFTIADPKDPGMLDVVGFDTASPGLISSFSRGDF